MKRVTFNRAMRGLGNPAIIPDDAAAAAYARGELVGPPEDFPAGSSGPKPAAPVAKPVQKPQTYLTKAAKRLRDGGMPLLVILALLVGLSWIAPARAQNIWPTSTLTTPPVTTTAYTIGQLIANNATAGSVVVPSISLANALPSPVVPILHLYTNDATATAWGGQTIRVDLWSAAPTFTNGDRGTWSPATGTAGHMAAFNCVMSAEYGDGAYAECSIVTGSFMTPAHSNQTVFWTLDATTGSGVVAANKVFTLALEVMN